MRRNRTKRGLALLTGIATVGTVTILTLALLNFSTNSYRQSYVRRDTERAFQLAEAGLQHAVRQFAADKNYAGQGNTAFSVGQFSVQVTTPPGKPDYRSVVTTGVVQQDEDRMVERSVEALINIAAPPKAFDYAMFADQYLKIGDLTVNSSPTSGSGDIHSNGTAADAIEIAGVPLVDGGATSVGGIKDAYKATITDGYETGADPVVLPTFNAAAVKTAAMAYGTSGSRSLGDGVHILSGYINGDLQVSGNPTIIFNGPVYVKGTVQISGNGTFNVGDGILVSEDKISFSGDMTFNGGNKFVLVSTKGAADQVALAVSGKPKITGSMYAPNGTADFSGDMDLFGSVVAKRITTSGKMEITRNTGLAIPEELGRRVKILSWSEVAAD